MSKRVPGDKSRLIPQKKTIHDPKKGTYLAIRWLAPKFTSWITPQESVKQLKEFLKTREKETTLTKYLRKNPYNVDTVTQEELKKIVPKGKTGEQYVLGGNVAQISKIFFIKNPSELNGLQYIICFQDGTLRKKRESEAVERDKFKKFKRTRNVGEKLGEFKEKYKSWIKGTGSGEKRQLGAVLELMVAYDVRVGSGVTGSGAVQEGPISVSELKRGMVVSHSSLAPGTSPFVVVEEKTPEGTKKVYLRSVEYSKDGSKQEEGEKLQEYKKQIKKLERKLLKNPDDKNSKLELDTAKKREKEITDVANITIPPKWTELIRVGHYGATELQSRHVKYPAPGEVWLDFIGKSGVRWLRQIKEKDLAEAIKDCQKGKSGLEELFPDIDRKRVAKELRRYKIAKPKDLRTYEGTKTFVEEAAKYSTPTTKKELSQTEKLIFKAVAKKLGNTPGMAKSAYTEPTVVDVWKSGALEEIMKVKSEGAKQLKKSLFYVILNGGSNEIQMRSMWVR